MKRSLTAVILLLLLLVPCSSFAKGVILNFTDVDIATMVKFISDLTGKNFVMDERVKGKISVYSPTKLSSEEAFNVFTSVLELKGFTLIQVGKVYKIVPLASAKQSGTRLYSDKEKSPVNESYVARVITLENIAVQEALTFLQPMVSKDGHVSAFGPANMLLVVDSSINIQKILDILKVIDTEKRRDAAELVYLKNGSAESIAKTVQEWLGSKTTKQQGQGASSIGPTVAADSRLNALLLYGSEKDKEDIRKLVALIDVAPPNSSSKVNVYPLENADATEVAKVLEGVVKGIVASQPGQQAGTQQQSPFDSGKITITADKWSNSLIIMASPTDNQNILQIIQKLDKRRRQVSVQAVIAEVSLDKLSELGVQWGVFGGGTSTNPMVSAAGVDDPFGTISTLLDAVSKLSAGGITNSSLALKSPFNYTVILKALQSNDIINVLSNPTILTSDNKEAEIFVGENVPFVGTSTIGTGGVSQQATDRQDVGIKLKITPQINEGDYIKLDISEEILALKDVIIVGNGSTDRSTTKRTAKTSVVVKNNETVAIGGLINESDEETISKVPLLGDIPLLGWFFKTKSLKKKKTNLILLLTPRVIKDERDQAETTARRQETFIKALKRTEPLDIPNETGIKP